jgi:hypothetical protein
MISHLATREGQCAQELSCRVPPEGSRSGRCRPAACSGRCGLVLQREIVILRRAGNEAGTASSSWFVTTHDDLPVAAGYSVDPARPPGMLDDLLGRVAGRFWRMEPRRRARAFVPGLLADLPRKNCWSIAEHAGDLTPDGMQHLLSGARWDADGARDALRGYIAEHLGDRAPCWRWTRPGT